MKNKNDLFLANMGNLCGCCKQKVKRNIVLLLVGLDNAGKTVAAKGLAKESIDSVVPTVGFSVVNLSYLQYTIKIFDLGGGPSIRGIWPKYFVDAHGLIFVVDSSDISRIDEAREVLVETLSHEKISGKPVLLLANKQDNENALDEVDIVEKLDLENIVNMNACPTLVKSCAATDLSENKVDPNIKTGYEWLVNYIVRIYDVLNKRVERDVAEQIAIESRLRMEKIEKIRAMKEAEKSRQLDEDAIESYSNYERKMNGQMVSVGVETDNDSDSIEEIFPPVCHLEPNINNRPKSATELIRQQLELNTINSQKKFFISRACNKTEPLQLFNGSLPRPASAQGTTSEAMKFIERRRLKSANDRLEIVEIPTVPSIDKIMKKQRSLKNLFGSKKNKVNPNGEIEHKNNLAIFSKAIENDKNGISYIDIE